MQTINFPADDAHRFFNGEITVSIKPEVSDAMGNSTNGLPSNTVRRAATTVRVKALALGDGEAQT